MTESVSHGGACPVKRKLLVPILVEGRYDKARILQIIDAPVFTTDGFGVFRSREKTALFRRVAQNGIVLLCDSDGGGVQIRAYLKQILPPGKVYDLYTPQIAGVEKRKKHPSRAGFLGVEGMDSAVLSDLFERLFLAHPEIFAEGDGAAVPDDTALPTKADLFRWGLTGAPDAAARRDALCRRLSLPAGLTTPSLLAALRLLYTRDDLDALLQSDADEMPLS